MKARSKGERGVQDGQPAAPDRRRMLLGLSVAGGAMRPRATRWVGKPGADGGDECVR